MGFYKERLTTTITAKLSPWQLRGAGIEGFIKNSTDKHYIEDERYVFLNVTLQHYRYSEGFWKDHFVMKTETNLYFYLDSEDMRGNDAPLV